MSKQDLLHIKQNISFDSFLSNKGFVKRKQILSNVTIFSNDVYNEHHDIIFIAIVNNQEMFYSLSLGDTGDIVHFVKNRIEFNLIRETFKIGNNSLIDTANVLLEHLIQHGSSTVNTETSDFTNSSWKYLRKHIFTTYYDVQEFNNTHFLETLGVKKETSLKSIFANKIYNSTGVRYNKEIHQVVNTVFPITNSAGFQKGLYYINDFLPQSNGNKNRPFFAKMSNKELLWQTNRIKKNSELTIVSSPLEALAHSNYFNKESNYLSFFELTKYSISEMGKIFTTFSLINLSLSVSTKQSLYELQIICSLSEDRLSINQVNETDILIQIETTKSTKSKNLAKFIDILKDKNNKTIRRLVLGLGSSASPYKDDVLFNISKMDDYLYIYCPKNYLNIYTLCDALIKSFDFRKKIKIDKPSYHNWIDQNKKEPLGYKPVTERLKGDKKPILVLLDKTFKNYNNVS